MYFPIASHYFDESHDSHNYDTIVENSECLICLEINDKSDKFCIKIQNKLYIKYCSCDGSVHENCLEIWYVKNKKCPICLSSMYKKQLVEINDPNDPNDPNERTLTTFNRNNLYLLIKISLLICFVYNFIFIFSRILEIVL